MPFCVVAKNGLWINLFQNTELAAEHYPEFRLVTDTIAEVYKTISASHPELLHPNLKKVTLRTWGQKSLLLEITNSVLFFRSGRVAVFVLNK